MKSVGYYVLKVLTKPLSLLPLGFHRKAGVFIGWLMGSVLHYRRDVVMTNLARSFPDRLYEELAEICRRSYRHLGTVICEAVWFGSCSHSKLRRHGIAEMDNPELLNGIFKQGKSVFVLTSHRGNWEILGGYESYAVKEPLLYPENDLCVVYRQLSSKAWDQFMYSNRVSPIVDMEHFDGLVESFSVMRYAVRNRERAKCYNFITDQSPYGNAARVRVNDFMNQPTVSMTGGVSLARMMKMPVLYMDMSCTPEGNYRMHYTMISEDASTMETKDILDRYHELLQKDLEREPWNYLWTHKRWKKI